MTPLRSIRTLFEAANVLRAAQSRRLLLIASHTGKLQGNPLGLALAAKASSDFLPVFLGFDVGDHSTARSAGLHAFGKAGRIARLLWKRAAAVAYSSYHRLDFALGEPTGLRVFLWHGMPIKGIGAFDPLPEDRVLEPCDLAIATSDATARIMASSFEFPPEQVHVTGEPKTDYLPQVRPDWDWAARLKQQYRKVIAYVPTWRERVDESTGRRRLKGDDAAMTDLVSKLVHHTALKETLMRHQAAFVIRLHAHNASNVEINPPFFRMTDLQGEATHLFQHADVVVGDYSSALIDSLLFDAAVAVWCEDFDAYVRLRPLPYFDFREKFGWAIRPTLENLVDWISDRLEGKPLPENESAGFNASRDYFHRHPRGQAGERVLELIRAAVSNEQKRS